MIVQVSLSSFFFTIILIPLHNKVVSSLHVEDITLQDTDEMKICGRERKYCQHII